MIKTKNMIPIFTISLLLIIIFVSTTLPLIKLLLALFSIAFLFPNLREKIFENRLRKIKVALYTSLIFTLGLFLIDFQNTYNNLSFDVSLISGFILVFFFSCFGNFLYGIPISLIAEIVSLKFYNIRSLLSGFIHIGFGLLTYFIEPGFFLFSSICSIIFFLLDELTRRKLIKET